jgi:hypothetical protein
MCLVCKEEESGSWLRLVHARCRSTSEGYKRTFSIPIVEFGVCKGIGRPACSLRTVPALHPMARPIPHPPLGGGWMRTVVGAAARNGEIYLQAGAGNSKALASI